MDALEDSGTAEFATESVPSTRPSIVRCRESKRPFLARIPHQSGYGSNSVPLLRRRRAWWNSHTLLGLRQAVAHAGEKSGLCESREAGGWNEPATRRSFTVQSRPCFADGLGRVGVASFSVLSRVAAPPLVDGEVFNRSFHLAIEGCRLGAGSSGR